MADRRLIAALYELGAAIFSFTLCLLHSALCADVTERAELCLVILSHSGDVPFYEMVLPYGIGKK
jgi:hypothetical protein